MADDVLWQRQAEGVKHDWPVDGVETNDFLTNHVDIGWPELLEKTVIITAVTEGRNIVGQGVDPDVNHVLRIVWYLDPPVEGGPGNGEVFQARLQEVIDHFVHPGVRFDEVRVFLVVVHQPVRVLAHLEEVGFFLDQLDLMARWGLSADHLAVIVTVNLSQLTLSEVFLIVHGVPTGVFTLVDVALVDELLEDLLDSLFVVVISRPDKLIVGDLQCLPQLLDPGGHLINVFLWLHAELIRLLFNLQTVLISPG